jgi:hypothetical protein
MHDKKNNTKKGQMLKKIFSSFLILILFFSVIFTLGCTSTQNDSQNTKTTTELTQEENQVSSLEGTCPKGKTTPCTGECPLFVDQDSDGFCDRGF